MNTNMNMKMEVMDLYTCVDMCFEDDAALLSFYANYPGEENEEALIEAIVKYIGGQSSSP